MTESEKLLARREAVVPRGVPRVTTATAASARGVTITDLDGRELLDFAGGIGVMNAGHCKEAVVEAIREQAGRLLHTRFHVATYEPYVALAEKLASLLPHGQDGEGTKVLLINSGAEAVENAVKIARQATGRPAVLCFTEGFHGRTLMGMSLTSKVSYKKGCGPFAPEVYRIPFPNPVLRGEGLGPAEFAERELSRLRDAFSSLVATHDVAAIIIEPVQGEGGFVPVPEGYLQGLRRICDDEGIVLIFDEVQTGFCRTGRWGAFQHYGVTPDLSTWATSMGEGLPIGAVIGRTSVMDAAEPGTIGGTYGGNPVACASALATIEVMESLDLNQRARELGRIIRERFRSIQERCDAVVDVRGLGAMIGMVLGENGRADRPAADLARAVVQSCLANGVLLITAGAAGNVLRVLSPLVIKDEELERGLSVVEDAVLELAAASGKGAAA